MSRVVRFKLETLAGLAVLGLLFLGAAEVVSKEPVTSTQTGTATAAKTTGSAKKAAADADQTIHDEVDGVAMVFPPDKCVVFDGCFDVICKSKEDSILDAEGELVEWEAFESPVRVASVSLYSGANTLQIGDRKVEVFVARDADNPGGPNGWKIYRMHAMAGSGAKRCGKCHEIQQESNVAKVGNPKSPEQSCLTCHETDELKGTHAQVLKPLEDCWKCHDVHGSPYEHLLKAPVEKPGTDNR